MLVDLTKEEREHIIKEMELTQEGIGCSTDGCLSGSQKVRSMLCSTVIGKLSRED